MKRHHRVTVAAGDVCGSAGMSRSHGANVENEVVRAGWNFLYLSPLRLRCFPPMRSRSRSYPTAA
jgi:hypothetical protein